MKYTVLNLCVCLWGLLVLANAQTPAQPTSTLSAQTSNNTSACSSSSYDGGGTADPSYCTVSQISQLTTASANTYAQTQVLNPTPGHVSSISIKTSYLYSGATTRIISAYQPWFAPEGSTYPDCEYYGPGGNESYSLHPCTGYSENVAATVKLQDTTMHEVGFTDVSPDWYGNCNGDGCNNGTPQTFLNQTIITEAADLATRASGYLGLMIMIDKGLITSGMTATSYSGGSPGCPASTTNSACVITVLEAAYDYIDHNWGRQSYYSTDPVSGYPMTLTFIGESDFPGVCWEASDGSVCSGQSPVWSTLKSYMSKYATPYKIVQEWNGTFGEVDGAYAWPQPLAFNNSEPGSQFCWAWPGYSNGECESYDYISSYYTLAQQAYTSSGQIQMGTFFAGFDGSNNNYNHNILARQCGQLFQFEGGSQSTGAIAQAGYSSSKQLPWILLATWNDYGEGTNIENGVDNCWRISTPTIGGTGGTTVSWSADALSSPVTCPSSSTCTSPTTIDQFKIWYGTGAGDLNLSEQSILPTGSHCTSSSGVISCSFNLSNATYPPPAGSTWYIYIQQIGAALTFDEINGGGNGNGPPVEYTPPGD
jgi:hypothetical protein